jgi:type I restriction-modification system DNA methylase subunit
MPVVLRKRKEIDYGRADFDISNPSYYSKCWKEIKKILALDPDSGEYTTLYKALVKKQSAILRESGLLISLM